MFYLFVLLEHCIGEEDKEEEEVEKGEPEKGEREKTVQKCWMPTGIVAKT